MLVHELFITCYKQVLAYDELTTMCYLQLIKFITFSVSRYLVRTIELSLPTNCFLLLFQSAIISAQDYEGKRTFNLLYLPIVALSIFNRFDKPSTINVLLVDKVLVTFFWTFVTTIFYSKRNLC